MQRTITSFSEALPNALIEAALAGVPCVSTDNGGASEIISHGQTGFIVRVGDDAAMARLVIQLIENKPLRQSIGLSARREALLRFSMNESISRILQIYQLCARR